MHFRRLSKGQPRLLPSLKVLALLLTFVNCSVQQQVRPAPKDYVFSPNGSRVRDLASFFNTMAKNNEHIESEEREQQDVIVSLSEAATKMHHLSWRKPIDDRCSKYVRLINRPNIRTYAAVSQLMKENKLFDEIEQNEANLVSRLMNERSFDALEKLQTLLQTLESEKINSKSSFDPDVQKDLLDCMSYYIYRHQRATSGIVEYVRDAQEKIQPFLKRPRDDEVARRKFNQVMDEIKSIETTELENLRQTSHAWLKSLSKLHDLMVENSHDIPRPVQEFVIGPKRLGRLTSFNHVMTRATELKRDLVEQESQGLISDERYMKNLLELYNLCESDLGYLLSKEIVDFMHEPRRWRLGEDARRLADELSKQTAQTPFSESSVLQSPNDSLDGHLLPDKLDILANQDGSGAEPSSLTTLGSSVNEEKLVNVAVSNSDPSINQDFIEATPTLSSSPEADISVAPTRVDSSSNTITLDSISDDQAKIEPSQTDQEHATMKSTVDDEINDVSPSAVIEVYTNSHDDLVKSCQQLYVTVKNNLLSTNRGGIELDKALNSANDLVKFKTECLADGQDFYHMKNWPLISLILKLSSWSSKKLRDRSLTPADRQSVMRVMQLLVKVNQKQTRPIGDKADNKIDQSAPQNSLGKH